MNDGDNSIKMAVAGLIGMLDNADQKRELFGQLSKNLTEDQVGHAAMMIFGSGGGNGH
jgi:hypothetical protein